MSLSKQLLDEIGKRINKEKPEKIGFSLLYQAVEEAGVEEFHNMCDDKSATVTILHGPDGISFGGFTSKSWNSSTMQKVADDNAFLFKKDNNSKCVFFPINKDEKDRAIICDKCFGPTFGLGPFKRYDLQAFKKDAKPESKKKGNLLKLNGSVNFKFSYSVDKNDGESQSKANNFHLGQILVKKVEVFQVTG